MVATYSLLCATGDSLTATVCTGNPCIPAPVAGAGAGFWQPAATNPATIKDIHPKSLFNTLILTEFSFIPDGRFK
jgi:hypothetical protein